MSGRSIEQFSSKSETSKCWIIELLMMLFFFSIVVNEIAVSIPLIPNCSARLSVQNDESPPLSRNAYVTIVLFVSLLLTLTGIIALAIVGFPAPVWLGISLSVSPLVKPMLISLARSLDVNELSPAV